MLAESIPIRVVDEGAFIHYPIGPDDLRRLMLRLPGEALEGLEFIELGLGIELIRELREANSRLGPDPYAGRDSWEVLPGIYQPAYCGPWDDGPLAAYREQERGIYLFALVYGDEPPHRPIWEFYLRLELFLGFIHALARHRDYVMGAGEKGDPGEPGRGRIAATEAEWRMEYLVPFLQETFPSEVHRLQAWMQEHGGFAIPLAVLAGEPPPEWRKKGVRLANGNFTVMAALNGLIGDVLKSDDPLNTRVQFARNLHYVEFYPEALQILEDLLAGHPDNLEAVLLKADIYVHQEEYQSARPLLEWALEREPVNRDALEDLARAHLGLREWTDLAVVTTRLLDLASPRLIPRCNALLDRSRAWLEMGCPEKAAADLDAVEAAVPAKYRRQRHVYRRLDQLRAEIGADPWN